MKNILALDASTKRTGWASLVGEDVQFGVISSAASAVEKRIGIMRDEIINVIKQYNIDTIIMEEVRINDLNTRTSKVLAWLQGCIAVAVYEYNKNIKIEYIGPSSWRSVLGIQGYRIKRDEQKKKDIEYANKAFNLNLTSYQDDEADALCILSAYTKNSSILLNPTTVKKTKEIGQEESAF